MYIMYDNVYYEQWWEHVDDEDKLDNIRNHKFNWPTFRIGFNRQINTDSFISLEIVSTGDLFTYSLGVALNFPHEHTWK